MMAISKLGDPHLLRDLIAKGAVAAPEDYARLGDQARLIDAEPTDAVLLAAVEHRHRDLAAWLFQKGANANARAADRSYQTALHCAAWNGDLPMVELLLGAGAAPNSLDGEHRTTPREWAEVAGRLTRNPAGQSVVDFLTGR